MQESTQMSTNKFPYISLKDVCELMQVDRGYLYANKHKVGYFQPTEGGKIWFKEESILKFIANGEVKPSTSKSWSEEDQRIYIKNHLNN